MNRSALTALKFGAAHAAIGLALGSAPAWAQPAVAGPSAAEEDEAIVVTGTRLSDTLQAPFPVVSVKVEELTRSGTVTVGDTLNDLPALHTTFGQGTNTSAAGTSGLNLLDLRSLGAGRTLVLVNGRRHVGADLLANGVSVDVNTIPTDLIRRVDIVTGGNSAVYGSDAIAGVVNFVLEDDFEGARFGAQAGISDEGDAAQQRLTLTIGKNFADGRGNIVVAGEYTNQEPFYASQRENLRSVTQLVQVDTDPSGSDGVADRQFFQDVRNAQSAPGGLVSFATGGCGQDALGARFDCNYLFQPDGSLVAQTGTRVGLGPTGAFVGGNGSTGREGEIIGLVAKTQRAGVNLLARYDFSDAAQGFVEAKYYRVDTESQGVGPFPIQGSNLGAFGGGLRERPRLDNPYLTDQARALITSQLALLTGTPPERIRGDTQFALRENLVDLGLRSEDARRETYRLVGGLRGELSSNFSYEISGNYGEMRERTVTRNSLDVQRFLLALDAARDSTGRIVCRSQISPQLGDVLTQPGRPTPNPAAQAKIAADRAACVPVNLFGQGNVSQAAKDYILVDTVFSGKITQLDGLGYLRANSSGWFGLPGGPIGVVIGAEYRRETNELIQDNRVLQGLTTSTPFPSFKFPAFDLTEYFGEVRLPLLANMPGVEALTLTASGRISDFGGSIDTATTYNINAEYSPVPGLRFRGGYGRAFRTPALSDLLNAQTPAQLSNFADPCAARNRTANTVRDANCRAAGIPLSYNPANTASLIYLAGGNPQLEPEYSNSWTLGGTWAPVQVPGLSLSVDYYDIELVNALQSASAQAIVNNCYDLPSLDNPYCERIQRNLSGTVTANQEQPYQILDRTLVSSVVNAVRSKVRGIDVDLGYVTQLGSATVRTRLLWTRQLENQAFLNPLAPRFGNDLRQESGDPVDAFNWTVDAAIGKLTLGYQLRYLSKTAIQGNAIENVRETQGRAPQDADYAADLFYPAMWYHNVRAGYDISRQFGFYLGVDNLFDRLPPYDQTGIGGNTTGATNRIFDLRGRYLYAGVTSRF